MNVVAIRCAACAGTGIAGERYVTLRAPFPRTVRFTEPCWVCDGYGVERPPVDHDKQARRKIEGVTEDERS